MKRSLLSIALLAVGLAGCDNSPVPLTIEAHDEPLVSLGSGPPTGVKFGDLQLLVKTLPDADVKFEGTSKPMNGQATMSFTVPKSRLKLGKNTFSAEATAGILFSKKSAKAEVTYDATPKGLLRFHSKSPEAGGGALSCTGTLCGTTTINVNKALHIPMDIESATTGSVNFGASPTTVTAGTKAAVDLDLAPKLAALEIAHPDKVSFPFTLTVGGSASNDMLELNGPALADAAAQLLAKAAQGPLALPGDSPENDHDLLVVVGAPQGKMIVVGKSGKLTDVDYVGVAKVSDRKFACTGAGSGTEILYLDINIDVYERRTGKSLGQKQIFADRQACPPIATGQVKANVREDDIRRVLAEVLTAKK